jgi:hypothetical protein
MNMYIDDDTQESSPVELWLIEYQFCETLNVNESIICILDKECRRPWQRDGDQGSLAVHE